MSTLILSELNSAAEYLSQKSAVETAAPHAFATAPTLPFPKSGAKARTAAPARRQAASARRRRARLNWERVGVILLMLASAIVGIYRLLWMGQF